MINKAIHQPDAAEKQYVRALSRESTIEAYANWNELSPVEQMCIDNFVKSDSTVLDLGCGAGRIAKTIGNRIGNYMGIDCSPEMISTAKMLNPGFTFLCEDILTPSYLKRDFDVVLMMNNVIDMLHPIERRREILDLIKSILNPSGILIFSSHLMQNNDLPGYYKEDYHGALVSTYRSSIGQFCDETENSGFEVKFAVRDYRNQKSDWAYIAASLKVL